MKLHMKTIPPENFKNKIKEAIYYLETTMDTKYLNISLIC